MEFKKFYKPNKEFKERNKIIFLSAFISKFPGAKQPAPSFRYFIRGAAFGAALVVILTAGATYADQKNVSATNILYPLKRTSEAVKVALTSEANKTEIHLELAERRLEELKTVREKNQKTPKIESLSRDLASEIRESIFKIEFPTREEIGQSDSSIRVPPSAIEKISETEKGGGIPAAFSAPSAASQPTVDDVSAGARLETKEIKEDKEDFAKEIEREKELTGKSGENRSNLLQPRFSSAFSEHQKKACEFWRAILEEKDLTITDLVSKTPAITEKFMENCGSFPNSLLDEKDGSEGKFDTEN